MKIKKGCYSVKKGCYSVKKGGYSVKKGGYSVKKGGYSVKNGFYIKNDCKNNDEDGSIDEDGYILDPLTYERISEGNLIQLSDGLCYNKSKNLTRVIKNRNTLPFGHAVTSVDKKKLSSPISSLNSLSDFDPDQELEDELRREVTAPNRRRLIIESDSPSEVTIPSQPSSPEVSIPSSEEEFEITPVRRRRRQPIQLNIPTPRPVAIPPRPNVPGFTSEWHPATQSYILRREPTVINTANREMPEEVQPEIIPAPRRRGRPLGSRNRNRTSIVNISPSPRLLIESGSPDSMEAQPENTPVPRRRGRPPGSRNRTSIMNAGRGTKKNKPKKH